MTTVGKMLVLAGGILVVAGLVLMLWDRIPFAGKLPGDIDIRRDNFRIVIPITTCILLSLLVSLIVWIASHWRGK